MEESLRNGVVLAKLAKFVTPDVKFRVFDEELNYFNEHGLNFRHTDNINAFRRSLEKIKEIFNTFLRVVQDILFLKSLSERVGSDIERL